MDFYGAGGHSLQLYERLPQTGWAWTMRKSHGFNLGDVPGTFDLPMFVQDLGTNYEVTSQFRLPNSNWTIFNERSYQTVGFELSNTRLGIQVDRGVGGTVTFDQPTAICMNTINLGNLYLNACVDTNVRSIGSHLTAL